MSATTIPTSFTRNGEEWNQENGLPVGWQTQHEWSLALEAQDDRLSAEDYRTVMSAIRMGLPVVLTRLEVVGERVFHNTNTVIVEALHVGAPSAARLRIHYWGFAHDVWLSDIVSINVPEATSTQVS